MHLCVSKLIEDGQIRFVGLCHDLSVQKNEQAILQAEKESAIVASKAKSSFLAHMSHELRTPLNGLLGMLQILSTTKLDENQEEILMNAQVSGKTLLEVINNILDLSKIEAGGLELESIGFDLKDIVQQVMTILKPMADKKGLRLSSTLPDDLPYLNGDPTRVKQIILNLVGNAIKYTLNGSVDIVITHKSPTDFDAEIYVEVRDTGIGIPADKIESVFQSFSQADLSTTRQFGGTGLGLTIVKSLVELMGGTTGVTSTPEKGSTFWCKILFPISDSLFESRYNTDTNADIGTIPPSKVRVLVVEDAPMNILMMKKAMSVYGITNVSYAENGKQALALYKPGAWDIILMDCFMPEMNGYDATKAIREQERGTIYHTPILAMTANAMAGDREECLRQGMDYYLAKPINLAVLKTMLSQWIDFS
jgi:CheY-like chemotaxis protein